MHARPIGVNAPLQIDTTGDVCFLILSCVVSKQDDDNASLGQQILSGRKFCFR